MDAAGHHHLRVTERALVNDLLLDPTYHKMDARDIIDSLVGEEYPGLPSELPKDQRQAVAFERVQRKYPVLLKFVEMRSRYPVGQEPTRNLTYSAGRVWNLHAGEYRGVTWFDDERNTVWLCASGFHRSGHRDDFYPRVVDLDAAQELLPTVDEIGELLGSVVFDAVSDLEERLPGLINAARQVPESEVSARIGASARVAVYVYALSSNDGEVFLGVKVLGNSPGLDVFVSAIAAAFPDAQFGSDILIRDSFPHRAAAPGEQIASCVY